MQSELKHAIIHLKIISSRKLCKEKNKELFLKKHILTEYTIIKKNASKKEKTKFLIKLNTIKYELKC